MNEPSECKLVAFDVFGTIADGNSHPGPYARIPQELSVDARKLSTLAQTRDVGVPKLLELLAPEQAEDLRRTVAERVKVDLKQDLSQIFLFPETVSVLSSLQSRGIRTALVSNLAPPYARPIIELLEEQQVLPDIRIWSFEVGAKKPDREIYEALFRQAEVTAQEVLFIGDKPNRDLWPPRELGCESRLIARPDDLNYDRAIRGTSPDDRIADLRDIYSILRLVPNLDPGDSLSREARPESDRMGDLEP